MNLNHTKIHHENTMIKIGIFGLNSNILKLVNKLLDAEFSISFIVPPPEKISSQLKKRKFGSKRCNIDILYTKNINEKNFIKKIQKQNCDLIINWEHTQIFSKELLKSAKLGILNLHRGLLPDARGYDPIRGEKLNGINKIGQTIHFISEEIDKGKIVADRSFVILNNDRTEIDRIFQKDVVEFYYKSILKVLKNKNSKTKQKQKNNFGRYYPKFPFKKEIIDWNDKSKIILMKMQLSSPFQPTSTFLSKTFEEVQILKFSESSVKNYQGLPGQVIDKKLEYGNLIKTGDNAIWINEIKLRGKITIPSFSIGTMFVSQWLNELLYLHDRIRELENIRK